MTRTLISWSVKAARKLLAAGREQTKVICGAIAKIAFKVGIRLGLKCPKIT